MLKRLRFFFAWFVASLLLLASVPISAVDAQSSAPFRVYMTFEDGPTDAYTPQILDLLAQYNAKATFLIAGDQIAGHEGLMQREVREGHALANHLWSEPGLYAGAPDQAVIDSYLKTEAAIRDALGDQLPRYDAQIKLFWQPGGGANPFPVVDGVQVITYAWSVNSDDCGWGLHGVDLDTLDFDKAVIDNVLNRPQSQGQTYNVYDYGDGVVIAFHDINRVTGRVLPTIMSELQSAGATFEALPRPWDTIGSMPVKLGVPPKGGEGQAGLALSSVVLEAANLRSTPARAHNTIASLPANASLTAIGRNGKGWIQVQYDGQVGWVSGSLIKIFGPRPSLPLVTG